MHSLENNFLLKLRLNDLQYTIYMNIESPSFLQI